MPSPFSRAIQALERPLAFAARDDFAHADRVRDLEGTVREAARRAASLAIPPDVRKGLQRIERAFADPLEGGARRGAVVAALEAVSAWSAPDFADEALARPVSRIPGVGPRRAEILARRGIRTVAHLLFHLPTRFDDRRELARVHALQVGQRATFAARVLATDESSRRTRGGRFRHVFQALVGDDTGTVTLRWFRASDLLRDTVRKDATLLVTGDVRRYRFDKELVHPEVERLADEAAASGSDGEVPPGSAPDEPASDDLAVVPDYPTPEGIPPRTLRGFVRRAVDAYADLVESHLPPALAAEQALPPVAEALRAIHRPGPDADVEALARRDTPAFRSLVLEELYGLEVGLALRRAARGREPGVALATGGPRLRETRAGLPFRLTGAQQRAWGEIAGDLARPHPMNRLLQGDVGSGKTVVAFLAAVAVAESGRQAALMAPTELLAEQHARTLARLDAASGAGLRVALLVASRPRAELDAVRERLERGEVDLVVGTHALVQESVRIPRLALSIVDEQHRFGVLQRQALSDKADGEVVPHTLVMTATPIPRTLALTLYGDLDVSVIDELPPGRQPVSTHVLRPGEGRRVVEAIRETTARGEQVYVVYPLVEETEKTDLRAASESAERIRRAFPDLAVDLVHGRLDARGRAEAMERFEQGATQILVSTTVIEVGVDVPRATLMVVEHAERFGLAQLHQLRGRVGRGARPGTCLLVARGVSDESEARLAAMTATTDGFAIADADLRIRGPGEFLGTRQHGRLPDLWVADLLRDARLIAVAREAALATVRRDPALRRSPGLRRAVERRWGERLSLARVA